MRIVGWIGIGATLALMAVCSYFNWAYQQTLGHGPEAAMAFGAAAVSIDIFKSIFPLSIMRAWDEGRYGGMALPSLGFAICFCCSIISEFGFLSHNRAAVIGDREAVALQYQTVTQDLSESQTKLQALGAVRPVSVIEEALRGQRVDRQWAASNDCAQPSSEAARRFCKSFFATTAELAASVETARLARHINAINADLVRLKKNGGSAESDPQARSLAKLLPWFGLEKVTLGVTALFPLAFEFVAAFGLAISTRLIPSNAIKAGVAEARQARSVREAAREPAAPRQVPLQPMRFGRDSDGSIIVQA